MNKPVQYKEKNIQKLALQFVNDPSEKTFNPLAERLNWGLRKHIFKIVQNNEVTDELILKTFEDIWTKYNQFDKERGQFSSWAYGIARNNALLYLQEQKAHRNHHIGIDISDLYDSTFNSESEKSTPYEDEMDNVAYNDEFDGIIDENGNLVAINKNTLIDNMADASIKCIDYLPDNYRLVLREQLVNKKKINQIAEDNNIPMTTIVNWLYKGKIKLQEVVKDKYKNLYESYRMYYPTGV